MITKVAAFFICLLLSTVTFCAETKNLSREDVSSIVKTNFLYGESPIRYYSNILISLQGNPTSDDSLIFRELVDTLNILIDKWDVHLIPQGTTNLNFEFGIPHDGIQANPGNLMRNNGNEIIQNKVNLATLKNDTP